MMETVGTPKQQPYSPHLKKVLKTYQLTAVKSLQGPSNLLAAAAVGKDANVGSPPPSKEQREEEEGEEVVTAAAPGGGQDPRSPSTPPPPPFPIQQLPILTTPDRSRSERSETSLEGESISCFVVGGERRLCLPQVLNSVLRDFTLQQINQVCDELQIYCSRCNAEQLEVLKAAGILPTTAPSCGLITKTDAERLCSALLHRSGQPPPKSAPVTASPPPASVRVYHECFGKCKGIYSPELHRDGDSSCIQCVECRHMFSPQRFVCHVHRSAENRTCHWGFDSSNWRAYLLVAGDQPAGHERLAKLLDERPSQVAAPFKRKQAPATPDLKEAADLALKKPKLDAVAAAVAQDAYHAYLYDAQLLTLYDQWARMSAFRVWPPPAPGHAKDGKGASIFRDSGLGTAVPAYLSHSPPVLLHPERVVPLSESERFERSYQPNVALAPLPPHLRPRQDAAAAAAARPEVPAKAQDIHTEVETKPWPGKNSPAATVPGTLATSNNSTGYNPEIELSTDTDDSSLDIATETAAVVDQVAAVMDALSDAKEATRARVVGLVRRLAAERDAACERCRALRAENQALLGAGGRREGQVAQLEARVAELERRLRAPPPVKPDPDEPRTSAAVAEPVKSGSPVSVITSQPSVKLEPLASPE
ncbi:ski oncogene [Bacillus rossius redtenbacheri]|uniref:ski oncogene n=1 Tax=Bacillus rossius redtenbacheri TaxID=93214 RepID=UPI002FDDBA35